MAGPVEEMKSYLVSLGFVVDNNTYTNFKKVLAETNTVVDKATTGWARSFVSAAGVIGGALISITTATAGMLDKLAQADLGYRKWALHMYMGADAAKRMKIALDALGESMDDVAWIPELRQRYFALTQQETLMTPPHGFDSQMRQIRDMRFEFTRLRVEMTYGTQWIGSYLMKYLNVPISGFYEWMQKLNDSITRNMPAWTEKVARFLTTIINLAGSVKRALEDMFNPIKDKIKEVWSGLSDEQKRYGVIGAILLGTIFPGPFAMLRFLTGVILLLDDMFAYIDGRKSSKVLAPIWGQFLSTLHQIKVVLGDLGVAFNFAIQGKWKDAGKALGKAQEDFTSEADLQYAKKDEASYIATKRTQYINNHLKEWQHQEFVKKRAAYLKEHHATEKDTDVLLEANAYAWWEVYAKSSYAGIVAEHSGELNSQEKQWKKDYEKAHGVMKNRSRAEGGLKPGGDGGGGDRANNMGNIRSGPHGFKGYATPQAGVAAAANNLRRNYRGLTLRQIGYKWAPPKDGNDTEAWIRTVSSISGISPNAVPNLDDFNVMQSLLTGIATAEQSRTNLKRFTPEVIKQGVEGASGGGAASYNYQGTYGSSAQGATASSGGVVVYQTTHVGKIVVEGSHADPEEIAKRVKSKLDKEKKMQLARTIRQLQPVYS